MMKNSILLTCLVMLAGFVTVYGQKTTFRGTKTQVQTSFERQMLDMALKHLDEEGCDAADSGVTRPYRFSSFYTGDLGYIYTFTAGRASKGGNGYGTVWFDHRGRLIRVRKFTMENDKTGDIALSGRGHTPMPAGGEDSPKINVDQPEYGSARSNSQNSTGTNQYLYVPNSFDCSTFNSDPCISPIGCAVATTKLIKYWPGNDNEVIEVNMPIYNDNTCSTNRKLNSTFGNINYPCTNIVNNNYRRFCYQPNTAEYASLFIYHYGPKFYEDMMPLMGSLPGNLTIRPVRSDIENVWVYPSINGNGSDIDIDIDYGVYNGPPQNFNLGADMFYVYLGMSQSLTITTGWSSDEAWIGMSAYMAQSYINAVYPGAMFGASNSAYVLNKHCAYHDLSLSIGTFFLRMENDPNHGLGRDKVHGIIKNVVEFGDLQINNINNFRLFAEAFYQNVLELNNTAPSVVSREDVCKIRSLIQAYTAEGGCFQPDLPSLVDLYIKDTHAGDSDIWQMVNNGEDVGNEPNEESKQFWISPSIWNSLSQDGQMHEDPKYKGPNVPNYMHVKLHDRGCAIPSQGEVCLYMSAASTYHEWPAHWENFITTINGEAVQAGKLIGCVPLTSVNPDPNTGIREYTIPYIPFDPEKFNGYGPENDGTKMKVCVLGRIVSEEDPMFSPETTNIGKNLKNNNNIAMKNMTVVDFYDGITDGGGFITIRSNPEHVIPGSGEIIKCGPYRFKFNILEPVPGIINAVGSEHFFESGDLELTLPESFISAWKTSGLEGSGYYWVDENTIRVTSIDFEIRNVNLDKGADYVVYVSYRFKKNGIKVGFILNHIAPDGCYVGGEMYQFTSDLNNVRNVNESRNKTDLASGMFILYPNPVKNNLIIESTDKSPISEIRITDVQGRLLHRVKCNDKKTEIVFGHYPPGVYGVSVVLQDGRSSVKKIIHE